MARLPVISGEQAIRAFKRDGWLARRRVGSHVIMEKEGFEATLSIPLHRELRPGTLRALIRCAGLTVNEFCRLLKGPLLA